MPFADDVSSITGRGKNFSDGLFGKVQAPGNLGVKEEKGRR